MASDNIAYIEDADDRTGSVIEGAPIKYARSHAPGSPTKEKANSGKSRNQKETTMRRSSSDESSDETTVHPVVDKREKARRAKEREEDERAARREERRRAEKELERAERRERERAASKKPATRPSAKQMKTAPVVHTQHSDAYRRPRFEDDPSQYGVAMPAPGPVHGHRPRAMSNRPASYYGQGSRPPPSNERWYAQNQSPFAPNPMQSPMPAPMPAQSPFTPTAYPPAWQQAQGMQYPEGMGYAEGPYAEAMYPEGVAYPEGMPYAGHAPPPPSDDYFPPAHAAPAPHAPQKTQGHLAKRFSTRPSSAMGHRSMSGSFEHEPFEKENIHRRRSVKIRGEEDPTRKQMPPPPRPKTGQPTRQALRPPPRQQQIAYESDDLDDESVLQDIVPHGAYDYDDGVISRPPAHRRGSSTTYNREQYRIEPASASARSRRHSYMGGGGTAYEQKLEGALAYQSGVTGGPTVPLTAAALKARTKKSKSSRSSGSSESRDESEYRQSATTRTTRSSAIDTDDVTIKVTGAAVVKFGNAEIQCQDGGEINITQPGRIGGGGGSEKASTVYSEDRQTRKERLPIRARASSQADTWSRASSTYDYPPPGRPPFF